MKPFFGRRSGVVKTFVVVMSSVLSSTGCDDPDALEGQLGSSSSDVSVTQGAIVTLREGPTEEYVLTPSGRFHKSCVREVPTGASVDDAGNVSKNGRIIHRQGPCRFKSFRSREKPPADAPVPTINGWVEWVEAPAITNGWGFDWFNGIIAQTVTPNAPSTSTGQTIFVFSSLEPTAGNSIIQPVLQYGTSAAGGGNFWRAAVWYVNPSGSAFFSTLATIATGDTILGSLLSISNTCTSGGVCQWQMVMFRNGSVVTSLNVTTGETFRRAQKVVLEVYNLTACNQYPNQSNVAYTNANVYMPGPAVNDHNEIAASLTWSGTINTVTPACSYATVSPGAHTGAVAFSH